MIDYSHLSVIYNTIAYFFMHTKKPLAKIDEILDHKSSLNKFQHIKALNLEKLGKNSIIEVTRKGPNVWIEEVHI